MDGRGNGRSDRPRRTGRPTLRRRTTPTSSRCSTPPGVDRVALVGISAAAMTVLRLAAEQPGARDPRDHRRAALPRRASTTQSSPSGARQSERMRATGRLSRLVLLHVFTEPHSTKPFEDGCATAGPAAASGRLVPQRLAGQRRERPRAPRQLPDAGDPRRRRRRVPYAKGPGIHDLVPGSQTAHDRRRRPRARRRATR